MSLTGTGDLGPAIQQVYAGAGGKKVPRYLEDDLAGMKSGARKEYSDDSGAKASVHYESEQAMGDNGKPARGYTTGHYHVEGPNGVKSFRHTPQGPTLTGAKGYAARQAADHINTIFNDRRGSKSNGVQGEPGLTAL